MARPKNPEIDGVALRDTRLDRCLSQMALGLLCGEDPRLTGPIDDSVISSYESGRTRPTLLRLRVMCEVLDIKPDDLLVKPINSRAIARKAA
jgi:transcriptional regulator with XRE-family HTH domain